MAGSIRCGPSQSETNAGETECRQFLRLVTSYFQLPPFQKASATALILMLGIIPRRFDMPDCSTFRVSGFGKGLEMRPMNFQSPVPNFYVCSFCRVIASKVVLLSCSHYACEACLAQCLRGDNLCPLDQVPIEDDAQRVFILTKRTLKVFCWNAPNGCAFSGTCMDVLQHFEQDCGFHSTSCPNCDALVLRDDVVEHLKSECAARVVQVMEAATSASTSRSDQRAYLEMKQLLEKIRDDHLHLQTGLNRLSEQANIVSARQHESYETGVTRVVDLIREVQTGLNLLSEQANIVSARQHESYETGVTRVVDLIREVQTGLNLLSAQANIVSARLHESYETAVTRVVDLIREVQTGLKSDLDAGILSCKAHVSREVSELNGSLSLVTEKVPGYVRLSSAPCEQIWVLEGWRSMTDAALQGTPAETESPLLSTRGYSVSQVAKIAINPSHSLHFTLYARIHSGPFDGELEWPFTGWLIVRVLHPNDHRKTFTEIKKIVSWSSKEYFGRPLHGPNSPYLMFESNAQKLEDDGFIVNDKLRLSIEFA